MLIIDIETGPCPDHILVELSPPVVAPPHPGEFDPSTVKYGNLKDEAKRTEKLEQARAAHNQAVAEYSETVERERAAHFEAIRAKAALSAITGEVVAIGYQNVVRGVVSIDGVSVPGGEAHLPRTEADVLAKFWKVYDDCRKKNVAIAGWNIANFDIPFLMRRSWKHQVVMPSDLFDRSGRYLSSTFVDLMQRFAAGVWGGQGMVTLDIAAKFFEAGGKNGNGKEFARLWFGDETERAQAVEYLQNDLAMTAEIAKRMNLV